MRNKTIKEIILGIIDFIRFQVENDRLTLGELASIYKIIAKELYIDATISDIADFYGVSEFNVRNVANRYMFEKPKRKVNYNFVAFRKYIPSTWEKKENRKEA